MNDYNPGHPWYYRTGGKILNPGEIKPLKKLYCTDDPFFIGRVEDPKRYIRKLRKERKECESELERDVKRYQEIIHDGPEGFAYLVWDDPEDKGAYYQALALKHNHILYDKSKIDYIDRKISRVDPKPGYQFEIFQPQTPEL